MLSEASTRHRVQRPALRSAANCGGLWRPHKAGRVCFAGQILSGLEGPTSWHPDEVRTAVVLSGTLYFGTGEEWDESKIKAYPAGTFYSEPSKAPHYTWAKDGEVIIQVTGVGPSGKTFVKK